MQSLRISFLCLLLAAIAMPSLGQGPIGNETPCGEDNLSCPRIDQTLQCYNKTMLCDGTPFCSGGSDEGANLVSLDCEFSYTIIIVLVA